jgi:hypothetical protein
VAALASTLTCTVTDDSFTVSDDVSTFRLDTPEGYIDIDGDDVTDIEVDMKLWGSSTSVDWEVDGEVLDVLTDCHGAVCAVDYDVVLPRHVFVDAYTGDGDIHLRDVVAGALLAADAGSIYVEHVAGTELDLDAAAGSVDGDRLAVDETTVTTGAGSVDLYYDVPPILVHVDAGVGDIDVRVPRGAYDIIADTDLGDIHLRGVDDDPDSPYRLHLTTGVGDVTVSGY